ncbi:MAG: primosomal protein N' [Bacteroidetes bacterium]|nr:primosomal protein N' [Bacteroidota bacterium]
MIEENRTYAEVLLPLPLPGTFCYSIPDELKDEIEPGKRVEVQFGKNRIYSALVKGIHNEKPAGILPKEILSVLDERPIVNLRQFTFWDWMSHYYLCHPGEIMNAALPSALKLTSESKIVLNPFYDGDPGELSDREFLVFEALEIRKLISMEDVSDILGLKKIMPLVKSMVEKKVIEVYEDLEERYLPKKETFIRLSDNYDIEENLHSLFDQLERRSENQLKLLMTYLHLSRSLKQQKIKQTLLLREAGLTHAVLSALIKKGVFLSSVEVVSRLGEVTEERSADSIILSPFQEIALTRISHLFVEKEVVLLHGVTSSGKTEIYIKLIQETLLKGKQVLFLLPEIALTTQIINRLRKFFGSRTGVYHSRYNDQEKVEIWKKVLISGESGIHDPTYSVILGARSAVFLPFSNLGLIIVDEEHDSSYKQHEPAPRYQARDAAIVLGRMHGAKVILGSATPSLETYFNAENGKYGLVTLNERYGGIQLPEVQVVDMKSEAYKKRLHSHFSQTLIEHIDEALVNKEQVILFQNRRGFSLRLVCETCQWSPECRNCDVTLTYHKHQHELRCHYCGYTARVVTQCPACGGVSIKMSGFGTEKIEEELPVFFPQAKVARMDLDSTRTKSSYHRILAEFESGSVDILVGTQMVTKGLDFDNVSLVGILNADNLLSYPDFRSYERSYQLMAQVSGRSGRKNKQGKVIIQTWSPNHRIIELVVRNDFVNMYREQLQERNTFRYPPYYRILQISVKHKDQKILTDAAIQLASGLREHLGKRVIGPEYPLVSRINLFYIKQIMIKIERDAALARVKALILQLVRELEKRKEFRQVRVIMDVDPY